MTICNSAIQRINFSRTILACMALALLATQANQTQAGLLPNDIGEISVKIAAKMEAITDPTNHAMMMGAMWDLPAVRRVERNMPWVEVTNSSNSTANLTQFDLSIGDERFNFSNDNFANFTVISPLSDISVGNVSSQSTDGTNGIRLNFNNGGLAPGGKVLFRIQLGVDAGQNNILAQTSHPDYRTVLFDMNGIDAYGSSPFTPMPLDDSDNAMFVGTFRDDPMFATQPAALSDQVVVGPQATIFNQHFRPEHTMEDVDVFAASVGVVGTPAIPEPNSATLAILGMAIFGLVAQRRTSDRRQQSAYSATYCRKNQPRPSRQTACRHRQSRHAAR